MAIPIPRAVEMGSKTFYRLMQNQAGASQPFNPVSDNPPIISDNIPNIETTPRSHPLCQDLPPELQIYGQFLRQETSARYSVLQTLYRYLKVFRFEQRQLAAGFGPVQPASLNHDRVTTLFCDMLGYGTSEIANRIEELYLEFYGYYQTLLQTSPQDLERFPRREAVNPE
jgi:hypothetical protein